MVGFSDRTLIYGPNALGKTNILEALYTLATTRSFKGKDPDVIKKGAEFSRIAGVIEKDSGDSDVEVFLNSGSPRVSKNFKIKGAKKSSIDFVGEFSAIVFSPDDLLLISGPPEIKRRYLSFTIGQKDREYLFNLLNYKKILRHRNDLLKKADLGTIREEIDIWNETLAENGQKIIEKRKELANFINERINSYYEELAGEAKELTFDYRPELWGESLLESLRNAQDRDIYEKVTTVGPHRDNWVILTNEGEAANFASRGEYRTIILALKLCEKDWFLEKEKDPPVILLDDVFSELDESRRKYLVNAFNGCQIIMTTTDLDHLDPAFHADTLLLNIQDIGNALSEGLEKEEVLF
jgi:DNA replication and repair protein RecF